MKHSNWTSSPIVVGLALLSIASPGHAAGPPNEGSSQVAYLEASSPGKFDSFQNVALLGDAIVVGAPLEDSASTGIGGDPSDNGASASGAAYVFVPGASAWSQAAYLKASNAEAWDFFGRGVAASGNLLVIGADGEASSATGVDGDRTDNGADDSGAVYVFTSSETGWSEVAYLKASNTGAGDRFGRSVAVDGDTIVVGAPREASAATGVGGDPFDDTATHSGAAYVFGRNGSTWTQEAYLKSSDTAAYDNFGETVAIDGDTAVVGAPFDYGGGAVFVFVRSGSTWSQQACLKASNADVNDRFGFALDVSADRVLVGAINEASAATTIDGDASDNSALLAGAAYVFARRTGTWVQEAYLKAPNAQFGDRFGSAVTISGGLAVVTAPSEDSASFGVNGDPADDTAFESGAAYVFHRVGTTWVAGDYLKASNTDKLDYFGDRVALSGSRLVVGAGQADTFVNKSGAAYVFELATTTTYCTGKLTSEGCLPSIASCGFASADSSDPLRVDATFVVPQRSGLLVYGTTGPAAHPFKGGTLCVQPPLRRTPWQGSGGLAFVPCDGTFSFDFSAWIAGAADAALTPGTGVHAQYWFRDDGDVTGVGLTDATRFSVLP